MARKSDASPLGTRLIVQPPKPAPVRRAPSAPAALAAAISSSSAGAAHLVVVAAARVRGVHERAQVEPVAGGQRRLGAVDALGLREHMAGALHEGVGRVGARVSQRGDRQVLARRGHQVGDLIQPQRPGRQRVLQDARQSRPANGPERAAAARRGGRAAAAGWRRAGARGRGRRGGTRRRDCCTRRAPRRTSPPRPGCGRRRTLQPGGIGTARVRSGSKSMRSAWPAWASRHTAWSMPPLCVPT